MAPSLMAGETEILDLDIVTYAVDKRPITPDEVKLVPGLTSTPDDISAAFLADQVAMRISELIGDREPWRQEYVVRLPGFGDTALVLPRFPVETPIADAEGLQVPEVSLLHGLDTFSTGTDQVVEADTYQIRSNCHKELYRRRGWRWTTQFSSGVRPDPLPGLETSDYTIGNSAGLGAAGSLTAGYLMPGQVGSLPDGPRQDPPAAAIETWQSNTAYGVGQSTAHGDDRGSFVLPSRASIQADSSRGGIVLECTVAGTTITGSEPLWDSTIGATEDDNGLIWTTRAARVLPQLARQAAWKLVALIDAENRGVVCDHGQMAKIRHMLIKACL